MQKVEIKLQSNKFYVDWLGEERPLINIPVDDIYCKHESRYHAYRNAYRKQLVDLMNNHSEKRFTIERERNIRLIKILNEKGMLYPIALHYFNCEYREDKDINPYICVDGHHRIMAHLTAGYDSVPAIIYSTPDEAGLAKANATHTDYYKDLMKIDEEIHKAAGISRNG